MSLDEIHPEELIAKAATRTLVGDEAADLDAHLARCPACALHVSLRSDVARALAPTDADYEVGERAVQRLLAATGQAPALPTARRRHAPVAARAAVIVAVILATSAATAALLWRARSQRAEAAAAKAVVAARVEQAHARFARPAEPPRLAEAIPEPPPTEDLVAGAPAPSLAPIEPPPATVPAQATVRRTPVFAPSTAARAGAAVEPVAEARREAWAEPPAETEPGLEAPQAAPAEARLAVDETARVAPPTEPRETPGALFEAAERAKRGGDAREAERAFARLAAAFAGSREEIAARPLRGQILLDDLGRPEDALASFERYLRDRPAGVLAEEARAGRAEALRQLRRAPEEADAWRDLLARHPSSIYAARARKRLAALVDARE